MADEDLDPARETEDPGYLEDAAADDAQADVEPEDQRKPYVHDPEVHGRDFRVPGNDVRDYYGVSPEYMTYANPSDAPIMTDTERFNLTDQYDHLVGNHDEGDEYKLTESQRRILREAGEPVEGDDESDADETVEDDETVEADKTSETEGNKTVGYVDANDERPSEPLFTSL